MAVLPPIRRLLLEDFASQKSWIEPLLLVENNFAESIVNALNKSLTLHDNSTGDIVSLTMSSAPSASAPAIISWTKNSTPTAIVVGQATTAATVTAALGITWQMSGKAIQITNLFGVTPTSSSPVTLNLVVLAG